MKYLAVDLEAVIDANLARKAFGMTGSDHEVREQVRAKRMKDSEGRSDFVKPLFWQVCAVGIAGYHTLSKKRKVDAMVGDERTVLRWLLSVLEDSLDYTLITFNGRQYDIPVLIHRALVHGLSTASIFGEREAKAWDRLHYRFDGRHIDIGDVLGGYSGATMASLHELALALGLDGKGTITGKDVEPLFEAKEWTTLREYVISDADQTLDMGLLVEHSRGRLPAKGEALDPYAPLELVPPQ